MIFGNLSYYKKKFNKNNNIKIKMEKGTVSLQIFDAVPNQTVAQNLDQLVRKLNQLNLPMRFVSNGYQTKYYIPEINEFIVLVNEQHILTNENRFKLAKPFTNDAEVEDVARYFLKCLEVGCGIC